MFPSQTGPEASLTGSCKPSAGPEGREWALGERGVQAARPLVRLLWEDLGGER